MNARDLFVAVRSIVGGSVIGGALGYLSFLPSLFVEGSDAYGKSGDIALGVTLVCARAGAIIGLIYFLIRRQLIRPPSTP